MDICKLTSSIRGKLLSGVLVSVEKVLLNQSISSSSNNYLIGIIFIVLSLNPIKSLQKFSILVYIETVVQNHIQTH